MLKLNKKGFIGLLLNPIVWLVILAVVAVLFLPNTGFKLNLFPDAKSQLMQEYTSYWTSQTDGQWGYVADGKEHENLKFKWSGAVKTTPDLISVAHDLNFGSTWMQTKHNFYGQEVALLIDNSQGASIGFGGDNFNTPHTGSSAIPEITILKPHTLNPSQVDVIYGGVVRKTMGVQNPAYFHFAPQNKNAFNIYFIGYKAQFSCDLAPDEVWIQQSFAQAFSINDLDFPPTKFCKETRPFTLRDISQGETAITPNPIPDFNRGEILTPTANSIITANYATPNIFGVTNKCDVDQANVKIAGKWVCSQVIKTTTLTREVPVREIIKVEGSNQFTFSTSPSKRSFSIGNIIFSAQEQFTCPFPSDVDIVNFPNPSSDCYSAVAVYNGLSYAFADKQMIKLKDNINAQFFASGSLQRKDGGIENKIVGTYLFSISNPMSINVEGGLSFRQNDIAAIPFLITNNLPSNNIKIKLQQKVSRTNQILQEKEIEFNANNGANKFSFDINTANLGVNEVSVQAFYPIYADGLVLLPSDKIIINVEVLGEQQSIVKFVEVEKPRLVGEKQSLFSRIIQWIKNIFS